MSLYNKNYYLNLTVYSNTMAGGFMRLYKPRKAMKRLQKTKAPKVANSTKSYVQKAIKNNVDKKVTECVTLGTNPIYNDWTNLYDINSYFVPLFDNEKDYIIDYVELCIDLTVGAAITPPIIRIIIFQGKLSRDPLFSDLTISNALGPNTTLLDKKPYVTIHSDKLYTLNDFNKPVITIKHKMSKFNKCKSDNVSNYTTNRLWVLALSDQTAGNEPVMKLSQFSRYHEV